MSPAGYLVDRFGNRQIGAVCLAGQALLTALIPLLAHLSYWAVSAARFGVGVLGAFAWPITFSLSLTGRRRRSLGVAC